MKLINKEGSCNQKRLFSGIEIILLYHARNQEFRNNFIGDDLQWGMVLTIPYFV